MAADAILNINLSSSVITLGSHLRKFSLRPIFSESSIKLITTSANITIECSLTRNTVVLVHSLRLRIQDGCQNQSMARLILNLLALLKHFYSQMKCMYINIWTLYMISLLKRSNSKKKSKMATKIQDGGKKSQILFLNILSLWKTNKMSHQWTKSEQY